MRGNRGKRPGLPWGPKFSTPTSPAAVGAFSARELLTVLASRPEHQALHEALAAAMASGDADSVSAALGAARDALTFAALLESPAHTSPPVAPVAPTPERAALDTTDSRASRPATKHTSPRSTSAPSPGLDSDPSRVLEALDAALAGELPDRWRRELSTRRASIETARAKGHEGAARDRAHYASSWLAKWRRG